MAASLLGSGGYGTTGTGNTAAAPAVLYDQMGTYADADRGACNAYVINNLDATNWLWIRLGPKVHIGTQGTPVLPGKSMTFVAGFNMNNIQTIQAWGTVPGASTGTAAAVTFAGGFQKKI